MCTRCIYQIQTRQQLIIFCLGKWQPYKIPRYTLGATGSRHGAPQTKLTLVVMPWYPQPINKVPEEHTWPHHAAGPRKAYMEWFQLQLITSFTWTKGIHSSMLVQLKRWNFLWNKLSNQSFKYPPQFQGTSALVWLSDCMARLKKTLQAALDSKLLMLSFQD